MSFEFTHFLSDKTSLDNISSKELPLWNHCCLTHYSPVLLFYTPWKQKIFRFSDVFRGYRKAIPGYNGLNQSKSVLPPSKTSNNGDFALHHYVSCTTVLISLYNLPAEYWFVNVYYKTVDGWKLITNINHTISPDFEDIVNHWTSEISGKGIRASKSAANIDWFWYAVSN